MPTATGMLRSSALFWICLAALPSQAGSAWWSPAWSARRRLEMRVHDTGKSGPEVAIAEFFTCGLAAAGGADVRVVVDGRPAVGKVIQAPGARWGDFCRVAFEVRAGAREAHAYFGNPKAKAVGANWRPGRGLLLETRRFNGGNPHNLDAMVRIAREAGAPFGADFVRQVFHGFNPFGPAHNFVSIYRGNLWCATSGEYAFATSSDDASFLLIDRKLVVSWPGFHGAVGDARHAGKMTLTRGLHQFSYLHVQGGGGTIAVAAWKPPGAGRFRVIPSESFAKVHRVSAGPLERLDGRPAADFSAKLLGEAAWGKRYIFRVQFKSRAAGRLGPVRWQFGDGIESASAQPEHIYLRPGTYTVTLRAGAGGGPLQCVQTIRADRPWDRQHQRPDRIGPYARMVAAEDLRRLPPAHLAVAAELFERSGSDAAKKSCARAVLAHGMSAPPALIESQAVLLNKLLRDGERDFTAALAALNQAERLLKDHPLQRARVIREKGDVYFYYVEDLDKALNEYDKVVGRYTRLPDNIVRVTKIKIGDIHRKRGHYEKALVSYLDAERLKLHNYNLTQRALRRGMLTQMAEDHIRRSHLDEADEAISTLEWEFPVEKLRGGSSILRARAAIARKNDVEAAKQLEDLVRVSPRSPYAVQALSILADTLTRLGRPVQAREALVRLIHEHPQAEEAILTSAVKRLRSRKLQGIEDPEVMLAVGEGLERMGQPEEAIKVYKRLAQTHAKYRQKAEQRIAAIERLWNR